MILVLIKVQNLLFYAEESHTFKSSGPGVAVLSKSEYWSNDVKHR